MPDIFRKANIKTSSGASNKKLKERAKQMAYLKILIIIRVH